MGLKKFGVVVACERCRYASGDDGGGFEVKVPMSDIESGTDGLATLSCSVSSERHNVELKQWNDAGDRPHQPSSELQKRLLAAFDFVADRRVCGNRHFCPTEVVRIVDKQRAG